MEADPHSIAAVGDAVSRVGQSREERWRGVEGGLAKGRRTPGEGVVMKREGLVRTREELVRKQAGQQSRGHLLEEGHCEEEQNLAQQR